VKDSIRKVSIVGYGNVGSHLVNAFESNGVEVSKVLVRSLPSNRSIDFITDIQGLPSKSFVLVCVPDDQISEVIGSIPSNCSVAYTSGAKAISVLPERDDLGVFYPLQSFTKGIELDLSEVPFFIEANNSAFEGQLSELASRISNNVKLAASEERMKLHVAAVFVNNFTNHLFHVANSYLESRALDFNDLKPLISETLRKIESESPYNVQTGPARRGDKKTIDAHLKLLNGIEKELYALLTKSIQQTYKTDDKL
jgi:predicted short-subunit dehydrogenase-like oxidoreductase (DUF2520 family)